MQNHNHNFESEISVEEFNKQSQQFKKAFQESLENETDLSEMFTDELKHVQKMALIGKLNPMHKETLIEWMQIYPERFDNFCSQLDNENRQKLFNFLDL